MATAGQAAYAWKPTRAFRRSVTVTGLLILLAVVLGRFEFVVMAAPFAIGAAWDLRRRPASGPALRLVAEDGTYTEGDEVTGALGASNPGAQPYDFVVARAACTTWLRLRRGDRAYVLAPAPGETVEVEVSGPVLRWGRHSFGPARGYPVACSGLLVGAPLEVAGHVIQAYPATAPFSAEGAMPRAAGLVGAHRSRRAGEGGELAGVRQYLPGDRLRRIDWRVSIRTRQLHVVQTLSDRDADLVLLLDVLHEAGRSGGVHGSASVLDTTVRAAAAIGEHYLHQGDRVSLLEYSARARLLRPASGRRQFQLMQQWLLSVQPARESFEPLAGRSGFHLLPSSALVMVLTPLIDQRSTDMVAGLARAGRSVLVIDTLGDAATAATTASPASTWSSLVERLWSLDRQHMIGELREVGVPVVAWAGTGSLDQVLRDVTRMASTPRMVSR